MSETSAHTALAAFLKIAEQRLPLLAFCKHTPNEANGGGAKVRVAYQKRNGTTGYRMVPTEALRNAQMGTRAGVWDWEFLCPNQQALCGQAAHYWRGLAIEMKADRNGLTPEQRVWQQHYEANGWHTLVCYEWLIAAGMLVLWVGGEPAEFGLKAGVIDHLYTQMLAFRRGSPGA